MKRSMRKGFTLLELLVVIGVMGIMSTMAMIAGQQTTDAARANNIADGLEKVASAMMMYYADNADEIAISGTTIADVIKGAKSYLKTVVELLDGDKGGAEEGKYTVYVVDEGKPSATWWVSYTFSEADSGIKNIMANKAKRMGLKTEASDTAGDYDGTTGEIYMRVR